MREGRPKHRVDVAYQRDVLLIDLEAAVDDPPGNVLADLHLRGGQRLLGGKVEPEPAWGAHGTLLVRLAERLAEA